MPFMCHVGHQTARHRLASTLSVVEMRCSQGACIQVVRYDDRQSYGGVELSIEELGTCTAMDALDS